MWKINGRGLGDEVSGRFYNERKVIRNISAREGLMSGRAAASGRGSVEWEEEE
jgi:hypothetical protein